jgi:hypothetical protein
MPFRLDLTGISSNSRIVETDMARKSDGEKIDELISLFAVLDEQVKNLRKEVASIDAIQKKTSDDLTTFRRESEKETALLRREIDDLRNWKEERGRRLWNFGPTLLGSLIGGIVAFVVAYFTAHR